MQRLQLCMRRPPPTVRTSGDFANESNGAPAAPAKLKILPRLARERPALQSVATRAPAPRALAHREFDRLRKRTTLPAPEPAGLGRRDERESPMPRPATRL